MYANPGLGNQEDVRFELELLLPPKKDASTILRAADREGVLIVQRLWLVTGASCFW